MRNIDKKRGLSINPDKVDLYKEPSVESDPLEIFQHYGLTRREVELLPCLAQGKSNPEMGIVFNISPKTVSTYLDHIYTKLGVNSRIGAVVWFLGIMHQAPKSKRREVYTGVGDMFFGPFG